MPGNLSNNLNIVNKLLLFNTNILDEDIDFDFFKNLIESSNTFIFLSLNHIWSEYLKETELFSQENFLKSFYFVIKRFQKYLYRLKDFSDKLNLKSFEIDKIISINQDKINLIRDNKFKVNTIEENQNLINEEEYSILFNIEKNEES